MRSLFYILALAAVCTSQARAEAFRPLDVTVYGGFTLSRPTFEGGTEVPASSSGAAFGLGIAYRFAPKVSLGLDILYVAKGFRDDQSTPTRYDMYFLEFPVQVWYQASDVFAFHGGTYLPALLLGSTKVRGGQELPDKLDWKNGYGVTFGMRLGFRATPRLYVGVDFRFDYGLANLLNDANPAHSMHSRSFLSLSQLMFSF